MQRYVKLTKPGYIKEFTISISADDFLSGVSDAIKNNRGLRLENPDGDHLMLGLELLKLAEITIEVR